jgi:class 3 adenylate cyclase
MTVPLDPTLKGSEARLWKLIEERMQPGTDTRALDERVWNLFGEEWTIMATDLAGFSRRVAEFGVIHFLQVIYEHKKLVFPIIDAHDGILVKGEADSLLLVFKRPEQAVACAVAMQHACQQLSARRVPEEQILLCVGIGHGQVLRVGESDVYGAEVNAASKLGEDTACPDEILVTGAVRDAVVGRVNVAFEPLERPVTGCDRGAFRVVYPRP